MIAGRVFQRMYQMIYNWKRCPCNLLVGPGKDPSDQTNGHHADILVENGEAEILLFLLDSIRKTVRM